MPLKRPAPRPDIFCASLKKRWPSCATASALWRIHSIHHSLTRLEMLRASYFYPIDIFLTVGTGTLARTPQLHAELLHRSVLGDKVIDHERITGLRSEPVEAVAAYLVRDGLIQNVWLFYAE